jgi:ADP-ribosyl-[dinitrogen reductase] hydrolase
MSTPHPSTRDRFRGCLLGLAVGDAVGTTVEFRPRGSFPEVTDMVGGGPFGLEPGQWTDDTSMALCLATSLVERDGFDARDQMERYVRWYQEGYLSSTGRCFDIGNTVRQALERFLRDGEPLAGSTDPWSAGNGCIMRLAPVVLYFFPDPEEVERHAALSAPTTHGAEECVDACRLMARVLARALEGAPKEEVLFGNRPPFKGSAALEALARGSHRDKAEDEVRGSGYVVESLEAALWCIHRSDSFEECVLRAVNLGDDADTTAAVTGQLAGALYGEAGIPDRWLERVALRDQIGALAEGLYARGPT